MSAAPCIVDEETALIELPGRQQLVVERGPDEGTLRLIAASGRVTLSIRVTADGPVLQFDSGLDIQAAGELELDARRVSIRGREGVEISSGGDAHIDVEGDLTSEARVQNVRAKLGNVNLKANDDVKLKGERIRLNC